MTRAEDEAKAKAEAEAEARRKASGKATDTLGGTTARAGAAGSGRGADEPAAGDEPIDETKSLPDRWEVGQTDAEREANTAIAEQREADAKAKLAEDKVRADEHRADGLTEEERKQKEADRVREAQAQAQPAR